MNWSSERVSTLRQLWADGLSASQIAKKLGGVTRNAVIGKAHRMGLPRRIQPERQNGRRERAARVRAIVRIPASIVRPLRREVLATELALIRALPALGGGGCKFIPGDPAIDPRNCGRATAVGGVWCAQHARLVYVPSKPKAKIRSVERDERRRWLRQIQQEMAA